MIERNYKPRRSTTRRVSRSIVVDGRKIFKMMILIAAIGIIIGAIISLFSFNDDSAVGDEEMKSVETSSFANKVQESESDNTIEDTYSKEQKSKLSERIFGNKKSDKKNQDKEENREDNINEKKPESEAEEDGQKRSFRENFMGAFKKISTYILSFNPYEIHSIVSAEIEGSDIVNSYEIVKSSESGYIGSTSKPEPTEEPPEEDFDDESEYNSDIKAINAGQNAKNPGSNQIRIGNQTGYAIDIDKMLSEPVDIDMSVDGPKVLIVHTHATEAYAPDNAEKYNSQKSDRSMNVLENVVAVGDELAKYFNEKGIETLHDTALHDHPSFNGSYADSLSSVEWYMKEYPSIQIVFDLHRDSIVYDDGTKAKTVTKINGKNAAQLMFVVGTNDKGLYHPDWRENMKFALQLQDQIDQKYPNLMRYVNLRQERFNGHTSHGSVIIEVGTSGNSLKEAKYGMLCAAECIADYLNDLK